jgi:hypothetical protein
MSDARNIALTLEATNASEAIEERFGLRRLPVVRLGIAYALRHQVSLDRSAGFGRSGGTNYNIATVDDEAGTFRSLVSAFYDDPEAIARPYAALETLMSKGVLLLKRHIDDGTVGNLADLVEEAPPQGS